MSSQQAEYSLQTLSGLGQISSQEWSCLSGASKSVESEIAYNPFISHAYLSSLEDAGTVSADTGWLPQHLALRDQDQNLLGVMPAYIKGHSQGEYVFDHGWADAYERAGGRYYPKLQCSIPFTPATGPRLMCRQNLDGAAIGQALAAGARLLTERQRVVLCPRDLCA